MRIIKVICFVFIFILILTNAKYSYARSKQELLDDLKQKSETLSNEELREYLKTLSLEEVMILGRQGAESALKEKGATLSDFHINMSYLLAYPFYNEVVSKASTEKEQSRIYNELFYSDKTWNIFIKEIKDKDAPWLWRQTVMGWAEPPIAGENVSKEEAEASSISPSTWLKLLKTCQTIMKDKEDDVKVRQKAAHFIGELYPYNDETFIDKSLLHKTWQSIYEDARKVYNDSNENPKIRREANNIVEGVIFGDYSRLQQNEPLLVFSNKNELMSEFNQDINKQVDLLRNPNTPYELRYSALEGTASYHDLNIPQSSYIKQQTMTTFYEEKQRKDKKFFFELTHAIIHWYNDYSIKQDLKDMLKQNLDRKTKDKIRCIIRDIEILEKKYGS